MNEMVKHHEKLEGTECLEEGQRRTWYVFDLQWPDSTNICNTFAK